MGQKNKWSAVILWRDALRGSLRTRHASPLALLDGATFVEQKSKWSAVSFWRDALRGLLPTGKDLMYDYRKLPDEQKRQLLAARQKRGYPLHAPPHFRGEAGAYLITGTCYNHNSIFNLPEDLTYIAHEFLTEIPRRGLSCHAWVFQPNHYHLLLVTKELSVVSEALRILHSRVATYINK